MGPRQSSARGQGLSSVTLTVTENRQHCFLARLFSFIQHRFPAGQVASTYLFSPLTANRRCCAGAPMRATSIGHRINKHLESVGLYAGESNHDVARSRTLWLLGHQNHRLVRLCKSNLAVFWRDMLMSAGTSLVCSAWAKESHAMTILLEQ